MTFLLYTTAFSDLMREHPKVDAHLAGIPSTDRVFICSVVRGEIRYGIARLTQGNRWHELEAKAARATVARFQLSVSTVNLLCPAIFRGRAAPVAFPVRLFGSFSGVLFSLRFRLAGCLRRFILSRPEFALLIFVFSLFSVMLFRSPPEDHWEDSSAMRTFFSNELAHRTDTVDAAKRGRE